MNDKKCYIQSIFIFVFSILSLLSVQMVYAFDDVSHDTELKNGLVSYWPLDEGAGLRTDSYGSNDLSDVNEVSSGEGLVNNSAFFESGNYTRLTNFDDGSIGSAAITWSVWVRPFDLIPQGSNYTFTSVFDQATHVGYSVSFDNSTGTKQLLLERALPGNTSHQIFYPFDLGTENWSHIVMTYDGAVIKGYLNGDLIGSASASGIGVIGGFDNITIGSRAWAEDRYSDSYVDEVGLWNRALSAEEIAKLYNDGKGLPYDAGEEVQGVSSVAFIPGITGSRLYRPLGKDGENKIWESIWTNDLKDLQLDKNGVSKRSDIYTRDIVDMVRPITGWWNYAEGYEGFINFMNGLVADNVIKQWQAIPYDWRLATDDLILHGEETSYDKVTYLSEPEGMPYIIGQLEALADGSPTGKVTIIAHSNGGLVTKNLLKYLEETGNTDLLNKIDTVVLVAVPQLGTPKSVGELLHGTTEVAMSATREATENMPGAYGLLPSRLLFSHLTKPVVEFDSRLSAFKSFESVAGTNISMYDELKDFMLGNIVGRKEPNPHDVRTPNVLNEQIITGAETMHESIDAWEAPEGIHVIELVGTGLPTPEGIRYSDCVLDGCPTNGNYITHEWRFSTQGDGTVLGSSADGGKAGETYYFPLNAYGKGEGESYRHGTILSSPMVTDFIQHTVLMKDDTHNPYITDEAVVALDPRFAISIHSPVDIHLYTGGKHTGVLEGAEETELGREYEEKIPTSFYSEWGTVKYVGAEFLDEPTHLKIDGTGFGTFRLAIEYYEGDTQKGTYSFTGIPVGPDSLGTVELEDGVTPVLRYDVDGDGDIDVELTPGEELDTATYLELIRLVLGGEHIPDKLRHIVEQKLIIIEKLLTQEKVNSRMAVEAILKGLYQILEQNRMK